MLDMDTYTRGEEEENGRDAMTYGITGREYIQWEEVRRKGGV